MTVLASKVFTAANKVTFSGAQPDDHWITAYPTKMLHMLVSLKLLDSNTVMFY